MGVTEEGADKGCEGYVVEEMFLGVETESAEKDLGLEAG